MTLNDIFNEQIELNKKVIPTLYEDISKNPELRKEWFLKFERALRQESSEAVDSLGWKWWKKGEDDWDNVKVELIDMLHFWVSMCTIAGIDANDVIELYTKKNKLNHHRQDNGYRDGTYNKYEGGIEDNQRFVTNGSLS